jgi:hypothetical protein
MKQVFQLRALEWATVGQAIVFRGLSPRALGPRNFMKIPDLYGRMVEVRSGEIVMAVDKSRPLACLIRSALD